MEARELSREEVLAMVPQQAPFRFIDEIIELSDTHVMGRYTFKPDESFYPGHFPGEPIPPGVIMLESMCQVGVVALGIYILAKELPPEEVVKYKTLFTDAQVDFSGIVPPGTTVNIKAERVYWRRKKLRSKVEMSLTDGTVVASATVSGIGVKRD